MKHLANLILNISIIYRIELVTDLCNHLIEEISTWEILKSDRSLPILNILCDELVSILIHLVSKLLNGVIEFFTLALH